MKQMLMNTEMVKAILENRKTVTRRLIKGAAPDWDFVKFLNDPYETKVARDCNMYSHKVNGLYAVFDENYSLNFPMVKASYKSSDVLYVRESWRSVKAAINNYSCGEIISSDDLHSGYEYKAGGYYFPDGFEERNDEFSLTDIYSIGQWKPSIHMPKEAARLFLRVTDVRVEQLRPMGFDELEAEGIDTTVGLFSATEQFADLWDRTVKKSDLNKYGWESNPWVWVIEFERISKEEAYNL